MSFKQILILLVSIMIVSISSGTAWAASGSINVSPQNGDYNLGETFDIDIGLSGGGQQFNAAKADIILPNTLVATNLELGDCDFSFVKTPTTSDASFVGAILGGSKTNCTLYTLSVKATSAGNSKVEISNASLKSTNNAEELFQSAKNATFNIESGAGTSQSVEIAAKPTEAPSVVNGIKQYDLTYKIKLPENIFPSQVIIALNPTEAKRVLSIPHPDTADESIAVTTFKNVSEGVHSITTYHNGKIFESQIVNVSGSNKNIEIKNGVQTEKTNPILLVVMIVATLILAAFAIVMATRFYKLKKANKTQK